MSSSRLLGSSSIAVTSFLGHSSIRRAFASASDLRTGLSDKSLSNLSMASYRLVCSSSRARAASYLRISVINRPFSSVVKAHKNEAHDTEPTIGKGKIEEEQIGEEMENLFDDVKNSSDDKVEKIRPRQIIKGPTVEIGTIRVGGSPIEEIGIIVPFQAILSDGRMILGSNLYTVDKDDDPHPQRNVNKSLLQSFAFMLDGDRVIPVMGKCHLFD